MATLGLKTTHIAQLLENVDEVQQLLQIHGKVAGTGVGRKVAVEVLNKSALVLTVACWEAYVEDLAESALKALLDNATTHTVLPQSVLDTVASKNSGPHAWRLAGDGWKTAVRANFKEVLAKTTGALNTPRAKNVDDLFLKTIGMGALSSKWKWKSRPSAKAIAALDQLITVRGQIAHRVKHSQPVQKRDVESAVELISRLAARSSNEVREFVHQQCGTYPWSVVSFRGMT